MKLILALHLLAVSSAFSRDLWFSQMEDGDRVEVTEQSIGCFQNRTSYYEVIRINGSWSFREYEITWDKTLPSKILEKKTVGDIVLGKNDIKGLDGVLKYYRGGKAGASTTEVSLLLEYFEGSSQAKTERLRDDSGFLGLPGGKDIVPFGALAGRFKK